MFAISYMCKMEAMSFLWSFGATLARVVRNRVPMMQYEHKYRGSVAPCDTIVCLLPNKNNRNKLTSRVKSRYVVMYYSRRSTKTKAKTVK